MQDDYCIDDLMSGDSTDDEDNPRKKIPTWARGGLFKNAIVKQCMKDVPDVNIIFPGLIVVDKVFTDEEFKAIFPTLEALSNRRRERRERGSSAHWLPSYNSPNKQEMTAA